MDIKQLYGLYIIPKNNYGTLHAISFNQDILKEFIEKKISKDDKTNEIIIKPFDVIKKISKTNNPSTHLIKIGGLFGRNNDLLVSSINTITPEDSTKIFGFNQYQVFKKEYINTLIIISHTADNDTCEYKKYLEYIESDNIFQNNISKNPIKFDVYYENGILNA